MYKIMVRKVDTGEEWWEYGFTRWMMHRIDFLLNEQNDFDYERCYEIVWCIRLYPRWKIFKKCLTNHVQMV